VVAQTIENQGGACEGIAAFRRVLRLNPDFHPAHFFLVATYSELGREEEARAHLKDLLLLWPEGSLQAARQRLPYKDPAVLEHLLDNVARTGLT
jgi:tetratricopeptide (TPR) repeat protein